MPTASSPEFDRPTPLLLDGLTEILRRDVSHATRRAGLVIRELDGTDGSSTAAAPTEQTPAMLRIIR